jgi:hypothetical protein
MMRSRLVAATVFVLAAIGAGLWGAPAVAATLYVDLDSTNPTNDQTVAMGAGVWRMQATSGGPYGIAWNPWGLTNVPNPPGYAEVESPYVGWVNFWQFSQDAGATWEPTGAPLKYATPELALAGAPAVFMLLAAPQNVKFRIADFPYTDNVGGLRIGLELVRPPSPGVPAPATAGLILLGVAAVLARRRA